MDYRNAGNALDNHTIIYGHNMKDKSMFATLANVLETEFAKDNHIKLVFENSSYEWEIISAYVTRDTDWMQVDFESTNNFRDFKQDLIHNSVQDFSQEINGENMLTLATCTSHVFDERIVVHAKLVEGN